MTLRFEGARAGNQHVLYLSTRARRELDEHLDLAERLARSSDKEEQARLKQELARLTFGE